MWYVPYCSVQARIATLMNADTQPSNSNVVDGKKRPHLVLLVHGIRDIARWQTEIRTTLESAGFIVELTNYGRMNLVEFILPGNRIRQRVIESVWQQIQHAQHLHKDAEISIIAHSFGTFVTAHILRRQFNLSLKHVIFCGSVLPFGFPFEQINNRFCAPVLNEVGTADPWPAIAESVTTGYGSAGTYGFRRPGIRDRFHNGEGHGYFLSGDFCRQYWIPFLKSGAVVPGSAIPELPPLWVRCISIVKLKYLIGFGILVVGFFALSVAIWGPKNYTYDFNVSNNEFTYWNAPFQALVRDISVPCWLPTLLCESKATTKMIAGREFHSIRRIDGELSTIISCRGFAHPAHGRPASTDPNAALRRLQEEFPKCFEVGFDSTSSSFSIRANRENMTSIARKSNQPALLCACAPAAVQRFAEMQQQGGKR